MLSRENAMREALSELEEQRGKNYAEEQRRRDELSAMSPKAAALLERRRRVLSEGMRRAFSDPENAAAISKQTADEMERINASLHVELAAQELPADWLQPVRRCQICSDTGYTGELIREQCVCLRRSVLARLCRQEGLQGLTEQNFERFDESVFPDEPISGLRNTQRGYMKTIRNRCERFAEEFSQNRGHGLLFYGETGVGKTYMMNCVAQRVLARGYSVVFVSAYRLSEIMRENQYDGRGAELISDLLTCDLLCIDDLGAEPMRREATVSGFYHIIGERVNANRAFVVTTNCAPEQLYERYGDRVAARLCDPGRMQIFRFPGVDVRRRAAGLARMS